jgi:hypothetical protein
LINETLAFKSLRKPLFSAVFRIRIHMFLGFSDPDPLVRGSVADPGCLSRIPDPDFYPSRRIPDPKTATKERGSHKFHKIVNYFSFEVLKKKIWANFQRII